MRISTHETNYLDVSKGTLLVYQTVHNGVITTEDERTIQTKTGLHHGPVLL